MFGFECSGSIVFVFIVDIIFVSVDVEFFKGFEVVVVEVCDVEVCVCGGV